MSDISAIRPARTGPGDASPISPLSAAASVLRLSLGLAVRYGAIRQGMSDTRRVLKGGRTR
jgi:hypothetical protein